MLPASNRGAGQNLGFPDVCLTPAPPAPPIPVPYPNIAMNAQALAFSPAVKVSGVNALNLGSTISMTSGDEAGVAHPTIKGVGKYTMGNPIVNIDRLPAIHLGCLTTGNMMNNAIGVVAVPSAVNVTYCHASGEGRAEVGAAELDRLAYEMCTPAVRAERLPADVALVTVPVFAPGLSTEVFRGLRGLGEGLCGVVIDLRGNPGGDLEAALALAGDFLPEGAAVARLVESDGGERVVAARGGAGHGVPLVILVDRGTASAAELFTAAMKANGRAVVVGERTYGKTAAQRLVPGGGETCARVDVARWSAGAEAGGDGAILPDVELLAPLEAGGADLWLQTAWAIALRRG